MQKKKKNAAALPPHGKIYMKISNCFKKVCRKKEPSTARGFDFLPFLVGAPPEDVLVVRSGTQKII